MSRSQRFAARSFLLAALVLIAAGCSKNGSSPTAPAKPDSTMTPEVAQDFAHHFAAALSQQGGVPITSIAGTSPPTIASDVARGQAPLRTGSSQEGSFSWSLAVTFYDAAGQLQTGFVQGVTTRAEVMARARGSLTHNEYRATLGIQRFLNLQGLLPDETTLELDGAANDTASCAFAAADGSASRSYDLLSVGVLQDIRQLKDSNVNPYPLSGVLRYDVRADAHQRDDTGERDVHYEAHVTVTYNGTRFPVIEVDKTWRFRMDLETGEVKALPS